jgi:hypothetical protein
MKVFIIIDEVFFFYLERIGVDVEYIDKAYIIILYKLIQTAIIYSISLFRNRFMDPLTNGDYPKSMRALVRTRLPKFTKEQSRLVSGSFDFIGVNYYSSCYASDAPQLSNAPVSYLTDSLSRFSCKHLFGLLYYLFFIY